MLLSTADGLIFVSKISSKEHSLHENTLSDEATTSENRQIMFTAPIIVLAIGWIFHR